MFDATLCYITCENKYLLLYRNKKPNDPNEGKWIGVGGKVEPEETPEQCIKREITEETGIKIDEYVVYVGVVHFRSDTWEDEEMYLFKASLPGNIADYDIDYNCNEGRLEWIDEKDLFELPLWEGDKVFLEKMAAGDKDMDITLCYEGDRFVREKSRF